MIDFPTFSRVARNLLTHPFRFAKTMPQNPHHYTLRKEWDSAEFSWTVTTMRQFGYKEVFKGSKYGMFNVNGFKYWTMGWPVEETILINRKPITAPGEYDRLAAVYDDAFSDAESRAEDEALFALIPPSDDVLDIGCGTGLLWEHRTPRVYTGIDPSAGMLARFAEKFPLAAPTLVNAKFEEFVGGPYDQVVSLFGPANYMDPDAYPNVLAMLRDGGSYFVMFFKPEYTPVAYAKTGVTIPYNITDMERVRAVFAGDVTEFGNYLVVAGTK